MPTIRNTTGPLVAGTVQLASKIVVRGFMYTWPTPVQLRPGVNITSFIVGDGEDPTTGNTPTGLRYWVMNCDADIAAADLSACSMLLSGPGLTDFPIASNQITKITARPTYYRAGNPFPGLTAGSIVNIDFILPDIGSKVDTVGLKTIGSANAGQYPIVTSPPAFPKIDLLAVQTLATSTKYGRYSPRVNIDEVGLKALSTGDYAKILDRGKFDLVGVNQFIPASGYKKFYPFVKLDLTGVKIMHKGTYPSFGKATASVDMVGVFEMSGMQFQHVTAVEMMVQYNRSNDKAYPRVSGIDAQVQYTKAGASVIRAGGIEFQVMYSPVVEKKKRRDSVLFWFNYS